jgi:fructose-specific phosphotransferase system IIC component
LNAIFTADSKKGILIISVIDIGVIPALHAAPILVLPLITVSAKVASGFSSYLLRRTRHAIPFGGHPVIG